MPMSTPATAADWIAAQRRSAGVRSAVSATKTGTVPSGSTITNSVTNVSVNASQFIGEAYGFADDGAVQRSGGGPRFSACVSRHDEDGTGGEPQQASRATAEEQSEQRSSASLSGHDEVRVTLPRQLGDHACHLP